MCAGGEVPTGKVGAGVSTEQAAEHARLVGLQQRAILLEELGSLDRIRRVVKILGMVNAVREFTEHSKVINGYSDVSVVCGPRCVRRRSAWFPPSIATA